MGMKLKTEYLKSALQSSKMMAVLMKDVMKMEIMTALTWSEA